MTSSDDGLARIDAMLEDYIPPSHLPLVHTPEEAAALGADPAGPDPFTQFSDYGPGSYQAAVAQMNEYVRYAGRRGGLYRERAETMAVEELLHHVRNTMEQRLQEACRCEMFSSDWGQHHVVVRSMHLDVKLIVDVEYMPHRASTEFVFWTGAIRPHGASSWLIVDRNLPAITYSTLSTGRPYRAGDVLDDVTISQRILEMHPFKVGITDEYLRRAQQASSARIRGQHAQLMIMDEISDAPAAAELAARGVDISDQVTNVRATVETLADIPTSRSQPRRPGPQGQQSTYGPPQRGRRH